MKLKDLTVGLSSNGNTQNRSVNIGPLNDGLNFIYGERGTGKTTIKTLVSELLLDSCEPNSAQRIAAVRNSIGVVVDSESGRFQLVRDASGNLSSSRVNGLNVQRNALEPVRNSIQLDRELADSLSFVAFRNTGSQQDKLHATLQNRFNVPFGPDAAMENADAPRLRQLRIDLQSQIDTSQRELAQLQSQRAAIEIEPVAHYSEPNAADIDRQIGILTTRLTELDSNRIRLEIESLQQDAARLRNEIANATVAVEKPQQPSRYLPTLYRLLDEIDQQIREVRIVQSNVQRHRVRLKEEMEYRNSVSVEEENHPYHRAREILRQIELRIDNADTRGDQWLEDHGTVDAQQVSNFLDETCRSVRDDLQTLCDELSNQYRDLRNHSATHELKELRHNFTHLSELIQQLLDRRDSVVSELHVADPAGADAIRRAAPEFCQLAIQSGHLAARQHFVGPVSDLVGRATAVNQIARDTSLQQQQLAALENRLASLRASLELADSDSIRISREINDLNLRKSSLSTMHLTQRHEKIARIDEQIRLVDLNIQTLTGKLTGIPQSFTTPHPLLVAASNILQHLTGGDYNRVWLSPELGSFEVQDRNSRTQRTDGIAEQGLSQLVHLSLVLAANESHIGLKCPLVLDDLFADLQNNRIDATLETLSRWCRENAQQILVLTQHRFLADRIPDASFWSIETGLVERAKTASSIIPPPISAPIPSPVSESWQQYTPEAYIDVPVAEYPRTPLPRPYPLSKYPRTTDRDRVSAFDQFEGHEYAQPVTTKSRTVTADIHEFVTDAPIAPQAEVVLPSAVGDRISIAATIDESTRIDSVALFDADQLRCLEANDIITVGEFLLLDSATDVHEFIECYLSGESLEHLQASVWLMNWVPGISANNAQALVACGISDPEHLLTSNIDSLFERVSRFLRSPDGRRFSTLDRTLDRNTVQAWQQRLRDNRSYRHQSRPHESTSQARQSGTRRHSLRAWSPSERSNSRSDDRQPRTREDYPSRERVDRDTYQDRSRRDETAQRDREDRQRSPQRQTVNRASMPLRSPRMSTSDHRERRQSVPPIEPQESRRDRDRSRASRKPAAVRHSAGRQSINSLNEAQTTSNSTRSKSKSKSDPPKLRFYLDLSDHIEAAPSIGPKTGARFEAIGVHTISDFLKITAESLAEKLNYKRLSAKIIQQYQNQTRLVCRIPNLRGHDAQLLVGCGIFEAEELASMRPETLFAKVAPFSDTKEGLKIIRNGKKPDLEEITDWISFAQHNRSLQAA